MFWVQALAPVSGTAQEVDLKDEAVKAEEIYIDRQPGRQASLHAIGIRGFSYPIWARMLSSAQSDFAAKWLDSKYAISLNAV